MSFRNTERPAILGGTPVRPAGPPGWPRSDPLVQEIFSGLIESGNWGRYHGPHLPELCRQLADFHDLEHVLTCCSGTAGVELALRGLGVQPDDEVILAGYDFKANFQNVLCLKAIPVLVDLDRATWQLDPDQFSAALSERTRAIVISHLHGGLVDGGKIRPIAQRHGIPILEDICQCPGASFGGQRVGKWGDVSVLSFGGSKLLTSGRGGAILTARTEIAERIKRYVLRGNDAYPLSEMQAAILSPQLRQLDELNQCRRNFVEKLCSATRELAGLKVLQRPTGNAQPAYYKVGFQYDSSHFAGLQRGSFVEALRAEGIAMDAGFRALHLIHAKSRFRAVGDLKQASLADQQMVTLHHPVLLEGESSVKEIVSAIVRVRDWADEIRERVPSADDTSPGFDLT